MMISTQLITDKKFAALSEIYGGEAAVNELIDRRTCSVPESDRSKYRNYAIGLLYSERPIKTDGTPQKPRPF